MNKYGYFIVILFSLATDAFVKVNAQANRCSGIPNGYFVSDLISCSGFYYCNDFIISGHGSCPNDHDFVERTQSCDPSAPGQCELDCPAVGFIRKPVRDNCRDYVECLDGVGVRRQCPGTLLFDVTFSECNVVQVCNANPCPLFNVPGNPVYVPDVQNCNRYFLCYSGAMEPRNCPPNLHWNPAINSCDNPSGCAAIA